MKLSKSDWITVEQASAETSLTRAHIYNLCKSGLIPVMDKKISGRRVIISRKHLDSMISPFKEVDVELGTN
jgi:predicted DNA-binding transcriptional regulator AlpA